MAIEEDNSAAWDPQNPDRLLGDNEAMNDVVEQAVRSAQVTHTHPEAIAGGISSSIPQQKQSFGDWLDRLVVAQGAKYWRWY